MPKVSSSNSFLPLARSSGAAANRPFGHAMVVVVEVAVAVVVVAVDTNSGEVHAPPRAWSTLQALASLHACGESALQAFSAASAIFPASNASAAALASRSTPSFTLQIFAALSKVHTFRLLHSGPVASAHGSAPAAGGTVAPAFATHACNAASKVQLFASLHAFLEGAPLHPKGSTVAVVDVVAGAGVGGSFR